MWLVISLQTTLLALTFSLIWIQLVGAQGDRADVHSLELVQVLYRHGDRVPKSQYPNDPLQNESLWFPYASGFSSLTKKGVQMQYDLGKYIRRRYDGFLSNVYSQTEIFVQSSDRDRTIMSALSNLAGLWPPTKKDPKSQWNPQIAWQPIPVHSISGNLDNMISLTASCPRLKELNEEIKQSPFSDSINKSPENLKLFEYVRKHSGMQKCDFETITGIWDTLMIQKSYNFTLPTWADSVYDQMAKLAPTFFDSRFVVPTDEAKRLKGGPLLSYLVRNMELRHNSSDVAEEVKDKMSRSKMYMLSGHDSTISVILGSIGVFETQFPPYASAVFFEMHRGKGTQKNEHFLRIIFRNDTTVPPYELKVPQCGFPCNLSKFKQLFSPIMVDGEEWKSACKPLRIDAQKSSGTSSMMRNDIE